MESFQPPEPLRVLLLSENTAEELGFNPSHLEFERSASVEECAARLKGESFAAVILDSRLDPGLKLPQSPEFPSSLVRMVVADHLDFDFLRQAVNKAGIFRVVDRTESSQRKNLALEDCINEYRQDRERVELVRQSSRQNRELEELTLSLENRVQERTRSIQAAKEQEEERLNRIRRLVRFIKSLAMCSSVEDLVMQIRNDLRPFHQVVAPALLFPTGSEESGLLFFAKSRVVLRSLPFRAEAAEDQLSTLLPNQMGRPCAKLIKLRLDLSPRPSLLIVEHTAPFKDAKLIETHLNEIRRPLEMALERLLLELSNNYHSFRWERTFDNLKEPISIIDRDMRILRSNRTFSDSSDGGYCYQIFAQRDRVCDGCPVAEVIATGEARKATVAIRGRSYQVQSFPIQLAGDGPVTNVVTLYEDITERRELRRKVLQSEKMSAIGLLANNIAHELNNPLTGLRALAQVLMKRVPENGPQHADLLEIERAASRSQAIIRNLLEFTKSGGQSLQSVTMDEVVEKTFPFLKSVVRNLRVETSLSATSRKVRVEPNLLQQVIFNLINNACQAMPKGGKLTVRSHVIEDPPGTEWVQLDVEDTGVGIPPSEHDKIFQPFYTTKEEGHGTGLGLNLSREIIEKFKGKIFFTSDPGRLTRFSIQLPAEKA